MTLLFIFWGDYRGFKDSLACARARAGCPIWIISDGTAPKGVEHIPIAEFQGATAARALIAPNAGEWASFSLSRWFVLRDFILKYKPALPIFCPDWDVLLFRNLAEAYQPFAACDYTVSVEDRMESAAYGVNRIEPLTAFCDMVEKLNRDNDPRAKNLNDMEAWSLNHRAGGWKVGNLFEIHNGAVFDHSMHAGAERFEMEGRAKKVVYQKGQPHFALHGGSLVIANTIHAWGTYKTRTAEVRLAAGIP